MINHRSSCRTIRACTNTTHTHTHSRAYVCMAQYRLPLLACCLFVSGVFLIMARLKVEYPCCWVAGTTSAPAGSASEGSRRHRAGGGRGKKHRQSLPPLLFDHVPRYPKPPSAGYQVPKASTVGEGVARARQDRGGRPSLLGLVLVSLPPEQPPPFLLHLEPHVVEEGGEQLQSERSRQDNGEESYGTGQRHVEPEGTGGYHLSGHSVVEEEAKKGIDEFPAGEGKHHKPREDAAPYEQVDARVPVVGIHGNLKRWWVNKKGKSYTQRSCVGTHLQVDDDSESTRGSQTKRLVVPLVAALENVEPSYSQQNKEQDQCSVDPLCKTAKEDP